MDGVYEEGFDFIVVGYLDDVGVFVFVDDSFCFFVEFWVGYVFVVVWFDDDVNFLFDFEFLEEFGKWGKVFFFLGVC